MNRQLGRNTVAMLRKLQSWKVVFVERGARGSQCGSEEQVSVQVWEGQGRLKAFGRRVEVCSVPFINS